MIIEALAATGLREEFLKTVHNYIERRKARIRLSHSGNWGIVSNQAPNGSVLSNTYYAYSLYCGQLYAALRPTDGKNALHRQSNVTVVGFFGTDNSIAGMVAPHAISMETNQYKPFDFTIVNHMAFFEGKKCSTSKNHGIWLHDIHHHTDILSDELRYVLSSIPLDHHVADITVSQLVEGINRLRVWRLTQLHDALTHITGGSKLIEINDELKASLARQSRYLMPESFDLSAALHETDVWLFNHLNRHNTANSKEVIVWLIGVALLGYPFMPQLALNVWQALGQHGFPATTPDTCHRLDCKFHSYRLTINLLKPLTYSQLDYCCRRTR